MLLRPRPLFFYKRFLQISLLFLSVSLVGEGLWGQPFAPANLTTQFIWVHYRGVLIFSLLLFGNLFCFACPFIFLRDLLRLFVSPKFLFPKKLRHKWTAIFIFTLMLFSYEAFALWSSPYLTALLIVGFFTTALIIDGLFKQASFCKYICPVGHFNFLTSALSPSEVKIVNKKTCADCKSYDCLKGNAELRGCELNLFLPKKSGNFDCTFCMDCVKACPSGNIELARVLPGENLEEAPIRSGIGKIESRKDFQFAILTFFFLGFLNAFLMTSPAQSFRNFFHPVVQNEVGLIAATFLFFTVVPPFLFFYFPAKLLKQSADDSIIALLPLGVGLWSAHYSFHFLTGLLAFAPLLGISLPTKWMGLSPAQAIPVELGLLFLGALFSCLLLWRKQKQTHMRFYSLVLFVTLFAFCVWILLQPMQMRSVFVGVMP